MVFQTLLFGSTGLLGQALHREFTERGWVIDCPTRQTVDMTDGELLQNYVRGWTAAHPNGIVVNAAALSNIDACQENPQAAFQMNARVPATLARSCHDYGPRFLHFSTDQVFGETDTSCQPHSETDDPLTFCPSLVNIYGLSKLIGEELVRSFERSVIVRVQWLFGPGRRNYLDMIVNQNIDGTPIMALTDYVGHPTYTKDVASAVGELLSHRNAQGVYHLVGGGQPTSRYDLTLEVLRLVGRTGDIRPVRRADMLGWKARRPGRSLLVSTRYPKLRPWTEAVAEYLSLANR